MKSKNYILSVVLLFSVCTVNAQWSLSGNSGTTSSDFLGTTDANDLIFKTNNAPRLKITASGNFGFGSVTTPTSLIHLGSSDKIALGLPDIDNNAGIAISANDIRFRTSNNFYLGLRATGSEFDIEAVDFMYNRLAGLKSRYIKTSQIFSVNNYLCANISDGGFKFGGQPYGEVPVTISDNSGAGPDFFPAMAFYTGKTIDVTNPGIKPASIHMGPTADGFTTGISFGGPAAYITNTEAALWVQSSGSYGTKMYFATTNDYNAGAKIRMTINHTGNVGIGTVTPGSDYKLDVNGNIFTNSKLLIGSTLAKAGAFSLAVNGDAIFNKAVVKLYGNWPDYVFNADYKLTPLEEVEKFIKTNKHLKGIPASAEIEADGIDVGKAQQQLTEKVEELTLYIIEQNKAIKQMQAELAELKAKKN